MTANKLHKILSGLIANGHGRKKIMINKETFSHPLESDGVVILPVESVEVLMYPMSDDDGGTKTLADGTESQRTNIVLSGE